MVESPHGRHPARLSRKSPCPRTGGTRSLAGPSPWTGSTSRTSRFVLQSFPGVIADEFGNFLAVLIAYNLADATTQLRIYASDKEGERWKLVYRAQDPKANLFYVNMGLGKLHGQHPGLFWVSSTADTVGNEVLAVGYFPIKGYNDFPSLKDPKLAFWHFLPIHETRNTMRMPSIAVSRNTGDIYISAVTQVFYNWAPTLSYYIRGDAFHDKCLDVQGCFGPQCEMNNFNSTITPVLTYPTFPAFQFNYIPNSWRSLVVLECPARHRGPPRSCLIQFLGENDTFLGQNQHIYWQASFNHGSSWTPRVPISDAWCFNRGQQSACVGQDGRLLCGVL